MQHETKPEVAEEPINIWWGATIAAAFLWPMPFLCIVLVSTGGGLAMYALMALLPVALVVSFAYWGTVGWWIQRRIREGRWKATLVSSIASGVIAASVWVSLKGLTDVAEAAAGFAVVTLACSLSALPAAWVMRKISGIGADAKRKD